MFEALGISRTEEQVYLRLLRLGAAPLPAIVVATGLTRRNAKAAMERLNALGLVSRLRQDNFVAVPLEVGVDHLIQQRRHEMELLRHSAANIGAELRARIEPPRDENRVTVLHRRDEFSLTLQQLCQAAHKELRVLIRSPRDEALLIASDQGLPCRMVLDTALEHVTVGGEPQLRLSHNVPITMALVDQDTALLPQDESSIVVRTGHLFQALEALFESVWTAATPLGWGPRESIDDQDRELLSLLVAGLTDDAAAARLGMSRRTVARRVQRLMNVTGAHSRLQLGWWAREKEWLS